MSDLSDKLRAIRPRRTELGMDGRAYRVDDVPLAALAALVEAAGKVKASAMLYERPNLPTYYLLGTAYIDELTKALAALREQMEKKLTPGDDE